MKHASDNNLSFLKGGGEMGERIRATNWHATSLGAPETWPENLRFTLSLILSSKIPMFLWWGEELIQFYNDAYRPHLGADGKHPEGLGKKGKDTWPEIWHVIYPMIEQVVNTGEATYSEDQLLPIYRNGQLEDVYWTFGYSPIWGNADKVDGVLVICNETTEKISATNALKESEDMHRKMLNNIPLVVWTAFPDGTINFISSRWEDFYGNPVSESLGEGWVSFVHHDDLALAGALWAMALKTGTEYETEFRVRAIDKTYRWVLVRALPVRNDLGEIVLWTGSNTDIHDKKIQENALEESEAKFRVMADNVPNLAWMADADGFIFWYNKQWYDYSGTTPIDMEGWGWQSIHDPAELPRVMERWQQSIATGQSFEMVFPLKSAAGEFRQFLTRVLPVKNNDGNIYRWFGTNTDITNQIKIEQSLKESELLVRSVVESAPFYVSVLMGENHTIRLANPAIIEAWGKGPEILGKTFRSVLPELANQGVFDRFDTVYRTGKSIHIENENVSVIINGEVKYQFYNYSITPIFNTNGDVSGIVQYGTNVTDLNLAKISIAEAEEKARLAITSAELGVYEIVHATDTMITDNRFKEIWDVDLESTQINYVATIHPDDLPIRKKAHEVSLKTGQLHFTVRIIWRDKSIHWVRATGKVIFDENNIPLKTIGIIQDTTEYVMAQNKILESEYVLRNMILQSPVAMAIVRGPEHVIEVANTKMLEIWDKTESEAINQPLFEILPEIGEQGLKDVMAHVYESGEPFSAHELAVSLLRNGVQELIHLNFVYESFMRTEGSNAGVFVVAIDVTPQVVARQKIEEVVAERTKDLAEANANLQRSNAELAQFAYIASHDLQEPLRKISTFAQLHEENMAGQLDEKSQNYLNKINISVTRMNKLIHDILAYSELVKGKDVFTLVDLNESIASFLTDYDLLIEQTGAVITYNQLPVIEAIPLQMSQLMVNMLGNALKFARKTVNPIVTVNASVLRADEAKSLGLPSSGYCKIRFSDNGIGIKPENTNQIFNIFQRLHGKSEYEGTGIGLAMCKKIVTNHSGVIDAEGSNEEGAVFNVYLPLRQQQELAAPKN